MERYLFRRSPPPAAPLPPKPQKTIGPFLGRCCFLYGGTSKQSHQRSTFFKKLPYVRTQYRMYILSTMCRYSISC